MTDLIPANDNAEQKTPDSTVTIESLSTKVEGLQTALANQNEANKRVTDGKSRLENDLAVSQAKVKELESGPKDLEATVRELEMSLARSNAISTHGIPQAVAAKLKGTPDDIMDIAATLAETYKKDPGSDTDNKTGDDKTKDPENPSSTTDANLSTEDKNKVADDNPPSYSGKSSTDIDSLMNDLTDSLNAMK